VQLSWRHGSADTHHHESGHEHSYGFPGYEYRGNEDGGRDGHNCSDDHEYIYEYAGEVLDYVAAAVGVGVLRSGKFKSLYVKQRK
jgi:hypothetical protein